MAPSFLRPGFPDAARLIVQRPALEAMLAARPFRGRVLNAGCGEGSYCSLIEAQPGVTRIDNIDVSVAPEFLAHHPDPRHHVATGSLTALPYDDATFDAVLCTEVLEHIEDHGAAASELARVLRPGGVLVASVPQIPAPFDPNHVREGYTLAGLSELLGQAGLVVEDHRSCCHALLRGFMRYWRAPLIRVGANRTPYVPQIMAVALAHADRVLRPGVPWDLVVMATKRAE